MNSNHVCMNTYITVPAKARALKFADNISYWCPQPMFILELFSLRLFSIYFNNLPFAFFTFILQLNAYRILIGKHNALLAAYVIPPGNQSNCCSKRGRATTIYTATTIWKNPLSLHREHVSIILIYPEKLVSDLPGVYVIFPHNFMQGDL